MKYSKKMIVDRIIPAQKVLSHIKYFEDTNEELAKLSIMFLPLTPGMCLVCGRIAGWFVFLSRGDDSIDKGREQGEESQRM